MVKCSLFSKTSALLFLLGMASASHAQTVQIQFGDNSVDGWNRLTVDDAVLALVDPEGAATGITLNQVDSFSSFNGNGTGVVIGNFPAEVTGDSLYGNAVTFSGLNSPFATLSFTGLDPDLEYSFEFVGTRSSVSDVRTTAFKLTGLNSDSGVLDAANNTTETILLSGIIPDGSGQIVLDVRAADSNTNSYGFYYLGGAIITATTAVPEPSAFGLLLGLGFFGGSLLRRRRRN